MKQAILLLTNRTDYTIRDRYDKLVNEYGAKADVFLFFDNSGFVDQSELEYFNRRYLFSVQSLIDEGYTALQTGFLGNCHYPLLTFHRDYPEYEFCWLVEDDVIFSGNWATFFDTFEEDTSDILTTKLRSYYDDPNWYWWHTVKAPEGISLSADELYASFNPVYRLSARALECLEKNMRMGWRGHFESVVPTVLARNGFIMHDMYNKGFYTEETHTWVPLGVQHMKPNMIYHPTKEKYPKQTCRKNCVLSVAGEHSTHYAWTYSDAERNYDVHLVVYDRSFNTHLADADFVYGRKGEKQALIIDYFESHPYLLDLYDYFGV